METDTQPETKSETPSETKRCQRCRKTFAIERFIDLDKDPDKVYAKCSDCRLKLVVKKNVCETCGIRGCFNFPGETFGRRCKKHSDLGMVDVLNRKCVVCKGKQPAFNYNGEKSGTHCDGCKKVGMINVVSPKCIVCKNVQPTFNFVDSKRPTHCNNCKEVGMIDIVNPKCIKCGTRACFNFVDSKRPTHCATCKDIDMINIVNPKCIVCNNVSPSFNFEGEKRPTHCVSCRDTSMIDLVTRKCIVCKNENAYYGNKEENKRTHCKHCKTSDMIGIRSKCVICNETVPIFNHRGETRGTHCGNCKEVGMIDVVNFKCIICNEVLPSFNFKGEKRATHCDTCKEIGMVDVKSRLCIVCNDKRATFNFDNTLPAYCNDCKEVNMMDVANRKCSCGGRANYALPGMLPEKCGRHKTTGMIKPPRKQCEIAECKEFATHGLKGPVHCENHAQTDEYLLTERNCLKCNRLDILNAQGLCVNFCSLEERDRLMKKQVKKKEEFVRKLLTSEIDLQEYVIQEWQDSIIDPTCTKRRPDFVYHCGNHIVIIEVDEDQHKSYSNCGSTREEKLAGENRRMFEIFQIFQGLPVVFIRYNPDGFRVNQKTMKVSDRIRHQTLVQWIKKCLREFQPGLWVKYLYYDDFNETDIGLTQIQEKDVLG
jgi:hypothetical protein